MWHVSTMEYCMAKIKEEILKHKGKKGNKKIGRINIWVNTINCPSCVFKNMFDI